MTSGTHASVRPFPDMRSHSLLHPHAAGTRRFHHPRHIDQHAGCFRFHRDDHSIHHRDLERARLPARYSVCSDGKSPAGKADCYPPGACHELPDQAELDS